MELHRLDGLPISGLDNVDIQDIDSYMYGYGDDGDFAEDIAYETIDEQEFSMTNGIEGLGYVKDPEIAYEILDEHGNVVMYADEDENLYTVDGLGELGFLKKVGKGFKNLGKFMKKKVIKPIGKGVKTVGKKVLKPVLKTFNRFLNPATILLRNGFLLAMKINMMKVAEKLRFGYLSDAEAKKKGLDPSGFAKLKESVKKAEKIYETAGGKASNLRKAILTGKGNKDKAVPLSGYDLGSFNQNYEYQDEFERLVVEADADDIEQLLNGHMQIDGLGAVAAGAALAAASSAVAAVAAVLDKVTGVFDKAKKTKDTVVKTVNTAKNLIDQGSQKPAPPMQKIQYQLPPEKPVQAVTRSSPQTTRAQTNLPATVKSIARQAAVTPRPKTPQEMIVRNDDEGPGKKSWASKNKILLIGTSILLAGGGGVMYVATRKKKKSSTLEGVPWDSSGRFKSKNKKNGQAKRKSKPKKQKEVTTIAPKALI